MSGERVNDDSMNGDPMNRDSVAAATIPSTRSGDITLDVSGRDVRLTNLEKVFWPDSGITKGDLIQYYAEIAPALLPHLVDRAMVMKRYPHGIDGKFFFMKRAPEPRPAPIVATVAPAATTGGCSACGLVQRAPATSTGQIVVS